MGGSYSSAIEREDKWFPEFKASLPSLQGKTTVITGTTSGTGFIAAETMAELGARVIVLNRASERATAALEKLSDKGSVEMVECDLMSFNSVHSAAAEVSKLCSEEGIDVLCCNAGIMAVDDKATEDGYDQQMQVNHLSHFILTQELWPLLEKAAEKRGEARVFQHTSIARKGPYLKEKYFGKNGGNLGGNQTGWLMFSGAPWDRYHQTKLANCVFTYALHDRIVATNSKVKAVVAHPGLSATDLQVKSAREGTMSRKELWVMRFSQSPADGTMPLLHACIAPDVDSGTLWGPKKNLSGPVKQLSPERNILDADSKELLWKASEEASGKPFTLG